MSRLFWNPVECDSLAKECAKLLVEAHVNAVPDTDGRGNGQFLRPILMEAQKRVLQADRRRMDLKNVHAVAKKWWRQVGPYFKELKGQNGNGQAIAPKEPEPPPPPPPPPDPAVVIKGAPDALLWAEFAARFFTALGQRQAVVVNIPGVDELRAALAEVTAQGKTLADTASRLTAEVGTLKTEVMILKQDVGKLKPPPSVIFCLGATHETQMFLRRKCDEGHLYVDLRFMDIAANARAFKADYVLTFNAVGHDWDKQIQMAVPRSHVAYIGGRHDQAIIQLRDWLKV